MIIGDSVRHEDRMRMFGGVFAPRHGEKVLFLVDTPHDGIHDSERWSDRRKMALEWYDDFKAMGDEKGFSVDMMEYKASGRGGAPISKNVIDTASQYNLVIAMTEFSASSSLKPICDVKGTITRCASMPGVERRMEDTAMSADYSEVKAYALAIKKMLDSSVGMEIEFSTGDNLYIDLRGRVAEVDTGDCTKAGQFINFPSGEAAKAPYEAAPEELAAGLGESKTRGTMPVMYGEEFVKYEVSGNRIVNVIGSGKKAEEMRKFFGENPTRRNIAEGGIGCNPEAVVTGNSLEDEKVGLHIAYGTSAHLGGRMTSDVHKDIVYAKGCPIEGTAVYLVGADGTKTELIRDSMLRYDLLRQLA